MIDLNIVSVGLGIITTLIGIGWRFSSHLSEIKIAVVRIETLLTATNERMDRMEKEIRDIDNRVRQYEQHK